MGERGRFEKAFWERMVFHELSKPRVWVKYLRESEEIWEQDAEELRYLSDLPSKGKGPVEIN